MPDRSAACEVSAPVVRERAAGRTGGVAPSL